MGQESIFDSALRNSLPNHGPQVRIGKCVWWKIIYAHGSKIVVVPFDGARLDRDQVA